MRLPNLLKPLQPLLTPMRPDDRFRPALVRLETALVFADGFDTGSTLAWRSWY